MNSQAGLQICFGVDPNPKTQTVEALDIALKPHLSLIQKVSPRWIKPNLAFFLRHGSKGIARLEEFAEAASPHTSVILDAKFNEIENSLAAYLEFTFSQMKVTGLTVNAFLGEKTISKALEKAIETHGEKARIFVLCATSEFSASTLGHLQAQPQKLLEACVQIRNQVTKGETKFNACLGVVVGANRNDVLTLSELRESELSVLAPGLGAQGANWSAVPWMRENLSRHNNVILPISRGIFEGGNIDTATALQRYSSLFSEHFKETER